MTELTTIERSLEALQQDCVQKGHDLNGMMRQTVQAAINLGGMLGSLKAKMPHGDFTPWVEAHMPVGIKQCQRYMRVAKHAHLIAPEQALEMSLNEMDLAISGTRDISGRWQFYDNEASKNTRQFVYVMTASHNASIVKVGISCNPALRARQLEVTPFQAFTVAHKVEIQEAYRVEQAVHLMAELRGYERLEFSNGEQSEWFKMNIDEAVALIDTVLG